MISPRFQVVFFQSIVVAVILVLLASRLELFAAEPSIKFDVPALCSANVIELNNDQKTVEIVIPVSMVAYRLVEIDELSVEIQWNRNAFPVVDYAPRTALHSRVAGNYSIEKRTDSNASLGLNLSGGSSEFGSGTANGQLSNRKNESIRYEEIPQHDVLVSSGTSQRGTGLHWRFKPSRTETLEGGRDLVVAFRVPSTWRGGILTLKCRATGKKQIFGSFTDRFSQGVAFVMPIHVQGDDQARKIAVDFVRSEQQLRYAWDQHTAQVHPDGIADQVQTLLGIRSKDRLLPEQWVHQLIQSGSDDWLTRYKRQLPKRLANSANDFVRSRLSLANLGR